MVGLAVIGSLKMNPPYDFESTNMVGWIKSGSAFGPTGLIDTTSGRYGLTDLRNYHGRYLVGSRSGGDGSAGADGCGGVDPGGGWGRRGRVFIWGRELVNIWTLYLPVLYLPVKS